MSKSADFNINESQKIDDVDYGYEPKVGLSNPLDKLFKNHDEDDDQQDPSFHATVERDYQEDNFFQI